MSVDAIVRSITHWTAGPGRATATDKQHYHRITEVDGRIVLGNNQVFDNVVTSDGDYAAHTLRLNTGSGGFAMAGMRGAVEHPFDPGPSPITEEQFEAHCAMLADFHQSHGIPVSEKTCLTHAEVEPVLGVKQRGKWDIARLMFKPELRGSKAVGDYMRERVRWYMGQDVLAKMNRPALRLGDHSSFVADLQFRLNEVGYNVGRMDAHFGENTKRGVVAFQGDHGILPDGVVGDDTWAALAQAKRKPKRDITEDDLREAGSRIVTGADEGERATKAAGGSAVGLGAIDIATQAGETLTTAQPLVEKLQTMLVENWPVMLLIAGGVVFYFYGPKIMKRIRAARTDDAVNGDNLKR